MQVESVTSKKQVNNHYVPYWVGPSIGYRIKIDKKTKSFHKKKKKKKKHSVYRFEMTYFG